LKVTNFPYLVEFGGNTPINIFLCALLRSKLAVAAIMLKKSHKFFFPQTWRSWYLYKEEKRREKNPYNTRKFDYMPRQQIRTCL
jgi:hypothetical protein